MKTVAVFFGGRSAEHDVSIITALTSVIKPLELTRKYHVVPVYIAKDGRWYTADELKNIAFYQAKDFAKKLSQVKPTGVILGNGMKLDLQERFGRKEIAVDLAFPAMHGTYGEDGALMGLLDMAGVPYVGCGVSASAVAMDKVLAKHVACAAGIPVTKYASFRRDETVSQREDVLKRCEAALRYPMFVKPAHLGSSIGISRAADRNQLGNALELAAYYDDVLLVEEAVENLVEVTLPVVGTAVQPMPALLEQPLTYAEDFFDFETKYLHGGKKGGAKNAKGAAGAQGYSKIPAELPKKLYDKAVEVGVKTFSALGCEGIARVDMLINSKAGAVYFNEVNPLPGSLYAHNWAQAGVSRVELVERLVELAEARHAQRQKLATTFDTSFLQQF